METLKLFGDIAIGINIILIFFNLNLLRKIRKSWKKVSEIEGNLSAFCYEVYFSRNGKYAGTFSFFFEQFHAEIVKESLGKIYGDHMVNWRRVSPGDSFVILSAGE